MEFSEKLKELRSGKGISQAKLAADIHISRSAVAKWENGLGLPNDESLKLLAEYFGITIDELIPNKSNEEILVSKNKTIDQQKKVIIGFAAGCAIGLFILGFIFIEPLRESLVQLGFLESNNIKTPEGKDVWSISVIRYMLSNEKYVGDVLYQKTFRTDCISKKAKVNRGEVTRYLISNNHPAIIDRDTFNLVQAELARRNNKRKKLDSAVTEQGKYSAKYALTELLVCGSCGGSFRRTSKSAKGKTTYYWRCVSRIEHGKTYCKDSAGIEEQMLHEAICRCLSKMMANSGEVFSLIQSNLSYAVSGNNAALDVFSIEKQMNELKVDIQQMTELAARTEGDPERYEVELKKMFDQLVILRGKLDLAKSQASQSDTVNAEVARIMDILKQTDMNFTEFDDVTVRRLVECIQVCGNKKIILTLKGGYQAEEELRKIEVA